MNERVLQLFQDKKILLKEFKVLDVGEFSRSRTLNAYLGINLKGFYEIVFIRYTKTRFLKKDALSLNKLCVEFEKKFNTTIKKRVLFYSSEICSKALKELDSSSWRCYDFM